MSNSPDSRESATRLMAETFHDEWSTGPAAAMARRAAAHARHHRRMRRVLAVSGVAALVTLATIVSWSRWSARSPATTPAPAFATTTPAKKPLAYEIISDTELETLMRNRPVLILPQHDGVKKIVVLDH